MTSASLHFAVNHMDLPKAEGQCRDLDVDSSDSLGRKRSVIFELDLRKLQADVCTSYQEILFEI